MEIEAGSQQPSPGWPLNGHGISFKDKLLGASGDDLLKDVYLIDGDSITIQYEGGKKLLQKFLLYDDVKQELRKKWEDAVI